MREGERERKKNRRMREIERAHGCFLFLLNKNDAVFY